MRVRNLGLWLQVCGPTAGTPEAQAPHGHAIEARVYAEDPDKFSAHASVAICALCSVSSASAEISCAQRVPAVHWPAEAPAPAPADAQCARRDRRPAAGPRVGVLRPHDLQGGRVGRRQSGARKLCVSGARFTRLSSALCAFSTARCRSTRSSARRRMCHSCSVVSTTLSSQRAGCVTLLR